MRARAVCGWAGQEHTQPLSKLSYHSYQTGITVDGMVRPCVPKATVCRMPEGGLGGVGWGGVGGRDGEAEYEGCDAPRCAWPWRWPWRWPAVVVAVVVAVEEPRADEARGLRWGGAMWREMGRER